MKNLLALAGIGLLSACAMETGEMADKPTASAGLITSEAAFRSAIVGKTLTFEGSSFTANADGTISGPWNGEGISGTWAWDDGAWCREATIGSRVLDPDCQTFELTDEGVLVTRDRGAGNSFTYTIS